MEAKYRLSSKKIIIVTKGIDGNTKRVIDAYKKRTKCDDYSVFVILTGNPKAAEIKSAIEAWERYDGKGFSFGKGNVAGKFIHESLSHAERIAKAGRGQDGRLVRLHTEIVEGSRDGNLAEMTENVANVRAWINEDREVSSEDKVRRTAQLANHLEVFKRLMAINREANGDTKRSQLEALSSFVESAKFVPTPEAYLKEIEAIERTLPAKAAAKVEKSDDYEENLSEAQDNIEDVEELFQTKFMKMDKAVPPSMEDLAELRVKAHEAEMALVLVQGDLEGAELQRSRDESVRVRTMLTAAEGLAAFAAECGRALQILLDNKRPLRSKELGNPREGFMGSYMVALNAMAKLKLESDHPILVAMAGNYDFIIQLNEDIQRVEDTFMRTGTSYSKYPGTDGECSTISTYLQKDLARFNGKHKLKKPAWYSDKFADNLSSFIRTLASAKVSADELRIAPTEMVFTDRARSRAAVIKIIGSVRKELERFSTVIEGRRIKVDVKIENGKAVVALSGNADDSYLSEIKGIYERAFAGYTFVNGDEFHGSMIFTVKEK